MFRFNPLLLLVALSVPNVFGDRVYTERDVKRAIFADYDNTVRPVSDPNNALTVNANLSPLYIKELNLKSQLLVMDAWMVMEWKDDFLKWDPSEFNNITSLSLPTSLIWKPDLSVYTAAADDAVYPTPRKNVVVKHDGSVKWVSFFTIKNRCPSLKKQSNNLYKCTIKIGSWTSAARHINIRLILTEVDLSVFNGSNPDWILHAVTSERISPVYHCCPDDEYPELHFHVFLKSRFEMPMNNAV